MNNDQLTIINEQIAIIYAQSNLLLCMQRTYYGKNLMILRLESYSCIRA